MARLGEIIARPTLAPVYHPTGRATPFFMVPKMDVTAIAEPGIRTVNQIHTLKKFSIAIRPTVKCDA